MSDDNLLPFSFPAVQRKKITAAYDGGRITSYGGIILLARAERRLSIADRLAQLIPDRRDQDRVTHLLPGGLASSPLPAAMRTLTISTGRAATRLSSWPADGYPIPALTCARSRPSRAGRMRRACAISSA